MIIIADYKMVMTIIIADHKMLQHKGTAHVAVELHSMLLVKIGHLEPMIGRVSPLLASCQQLL